MPYLAAKRTHPYFLPMTHYQGGSTSLHQAAAQGHIHSVLLLVDSGAAVSAAGPGGATPLTFAAQNGHVEVVRLLLDRKALLLDATEVSLAIMIRQTAHCATVWGNDHCALTYGHEYCSDCTQ
jgi:ankyrin repeat protein